MIQIKKTNIEKPPSKETEKIKQNKINIEYRIKKKKRVNIHSNFTLFSFSKMIDVAVVRIQTQLESPTKSFNQTSCKKLTFFLSLPLFLHNLVLIRTGIVFLTLPILYV